MYKSVIILTLGRAEGGRGGGGGGSHPSPHKVFLSFFLGDKTSAPDVFCGCSFKPRADFEASSLVVSCYGYEI